MPDDDRCVLTLINLDNFVLSLSYLYIYSEHVIFQGRFMSKADEGTVS